MRSFASDNNSGVHLCLFECVKNAKGKKPCKEKGFSLSKTESNEENRTIHQNAL